MSMWLYQLSQNSPWPPERFRLEIWEGRPWHWNHGNKIGDGEPDAGDTLVLFYSKSGGAGFGFYGWAVIEKYDGKSEPDYPTLYFTPTAPTDHLKMDPWNTAEAQKLVDAIRGRVPLATLFLVPEKFEPEVRRGIRLWLSGGVDTDRI